MAGKTLLDLAMENPRGWGEAPPQQPGLTAFYDEIGNPYDAQGKRIYEMRATPEDPSLGRSLLNIAESPAKMLVGAVTEPFNALQRLAENSVDENGNIAIPNPRNPENQQDVLTGLLTLYGGNAMNPAAAIPKGALASGALREAERQPFYHGSPYQFDNFDLGQVAARRGDTNNGFAGISVTPNESMARGYGENVKRMYTDVSNPFVWDIENLPKTIARAREIYPDLDVRDGDFPINGRWEFSQALKDAGHDALDVKTKNGLFERTVFDPANLTLLSDTGKPSLLGSALAGASPSPESVSHDLFRNSLDAAAQYFNMSPSEFKAAANPGTTKYRGYRGVHPIGNRPVTDLSAGRDEIFASSSPAVAGTYAATDLPDAAMFPLDMTFSNPLIVQAEGQKWNAVPWNNKTSSTDEIARHARANGHDGLVVRNIRDSQTHSQNELGAMPPADVYVALKRGTVTSPLTGETLFSDTGKPSIAGAAVAGAEANTPVRAYHATDAKFDRFDPEFTDEVGFHFGNKNQAQNRQMVKGGITSFINPWSDWRTIPVDIDTVRPASISADVGQFNGKRVARQLVKDGIAPPSLMADIVDASPAQQTKYVRDWLVANGYDSVKYPNTFEGNGAPSYMALGTGNVKHAQTGDVLYSGAPFIPANDQDRDPSLYDLAVRQ